MQDNHKPDADRAEQNAREECNTLTDAWAGPFTVANEVVDTDCAAPGVRLRLVQVCDVLGQPYAFVHRKDADPDWSNATAKARNLAQLLNSTQPGAVERSAGWDGPFTSGKCQVHNETSGVYDGAAVFDATGEPFALVADDSCIGGHLGALARATRIAEALNRAQPSPTRSTQQAATVVALQEAAAWAASMVAVGGLVEQDRDRLALLAEFVRHRLDA